MQVIFSFDTEDYVDPVSNDALLGLAEIHTRHGVPACFGLVGEKARFLRTCGRRDVVEAVGRHEVGYHSDHHFMFADYDYEQEFVPEYIEKQSWDRAMARLLAEESRGVRDVAEIFGRPPVTWLRTFGDWAPHYLCTFAQLGVPIFAYGPPSHNLDPALIWYCNQLVVGNPRLMYENNLHHEDLTAQEKLDGHKCAFLKHLEAGTQRLGFVTHPTRFIADTWWEQPNWWDGILEPPPRGTWRIPPRFSREKTEELLWIADEFVRFVGELDDVEPLTFADFLAQLPPRRQWLTRPDLERLAADVGERPEYGRLDAETFSPAELFAAFAFALAEPEIENVPVRRVVGPVEAPSTTPPGIHVSRQDLLHACRATEMFLQDKNRVPHMVKIGSGEVGPGGFLLAMAGALRAPRADPVDVPAADNLPTPLHPDDYERLGGGRPAAFVQKRTFEFPNTQRISQLQYWTVRPVAAPPG